MTGQEIETFANALNTGFLKPWKANGIATTLTMMPQIKGKRLTDYIESCLRMEGFSSGDCAKVSEWIEAKT